MKTTLSIVPLLLAATAARALPPDAGDWIEETKLVASDAAAGHYFGVSVALDGDTALVGTLGAASAYVFVRSSDGWAEQAVLTAPDVLVSDRFGYHVSLSGNTALVGAPHQDHAGSNEGSAYVFVRSGSTWTQEAKLTANDAEDGDEFGSSLSLDGSTALIGAPEESAGGLYAGSAYVFMRSGSSWTQRAKITPSGLEQYDAFGSTVCVAEGSPTRLFIGNYIDNDFCDGGGSVYIYSGSGSSWTLQEHLYPPSCSWLGAFGGSLSFSGDTLLVGERGSNDYVTVGVGAVHVYVRSGANWISQTVLRSGDGVAHDYFGTRVSIDGDTALIGASGADAGGVWNGGAAYVFQRSGTSWTETAKLWPGDPSSDKAFMEVSLSGQTAFIGADSDDQMGTRAGATYVFSVEPGTGYCFGDPGVGTPCPCGNDNDGSVPGSGCDNGVFASGAQLTGAGVASVSADTFVLRTTGLEPNNTGLYFQGTNATNNGNGSWFGDGLRCAGRGVVRIQIRFCNSAGVSHTTIPIGAKGGVSPGDTKRYQCWYRNQSTPACGLGVNEFNLSNGYEVTWTL